jgi:uncharacterized protein PM0109
MNQNDMNLILQDVRKAYRLLADYQQRIIELITFIKKELDIEHFSYYFPNYYTLRYIDKIYNGESEIGLRFLPMMDFRLLLHKTKNISNNNVWQYNFQKDDLFFEIYVASDDGKEDKLPICDSRSKIRIYIYKCLKYKRKNNWYHDVWEMSEYPEFGKVTPFQDKSGEIEYQIYGESLDLSEMYDEESVRSTLDAFRKRASEKLEQEI